MPLAQAQLPTGCLDHSQLCGNARLRQSPQFIGDYVLGLAIVAAVVIAAWLLWKVWQAWRWRRVARHH